MGAPDQADTAAQQAGAAATAPQDALYPSIDPAAVSPTPAAGAAPLAPSVAAMPPAPEAAAAAQPSDLVAQPMTAPMAAVTPAPGSAAAGSAAAPPPASLYPAIEPTAADAAPVAGAASDAYPPPWAPDAAPAPGTAAAAPASAAAVDPVPGAVAGGAAPQSAYPPIDSAVPNGGAYAPAPGAYAPPGTAGAPPAPGAYPPGAYPPGAAPAPGAAGAAGAPGQPAAVLYAAPVAGLDLRPPVAPPLPGQVRCCCVCVKHRSAKLLLVLKHSPHSLHPHPLCQAGADRVSSDAAQRRQGGGRHCGRHRAGRAGLLHPLLLALRHRRLRGASHSAQVVPGKPRGALPCCRAAVQRRQATPGSWHSERPPHVVIGPTPAAWPATTCAGASIRLGSRRARPARDAGGGAAGRRAFGGGRGHARRRRGPRAATGCPRGPCGPRPTRPAGAGALKGLARPALSSAH